MGKFTAKTAMALAFLAFSTFSFGALNWVENLFLGLNVESTYYQFDMGTSYFYSPPDATMLYQYTSAGTNPVGTSYIVVKVDGYPNTYTAYSAGYDGIIISDLTKGSYWIQGTRRFRQAGVDLVDLTTRWEFVNNPATNAKQDTCMYQFIFTNPTLVPHTVGLRLELDTMIVNKDGANISVNNGFSVLNNGTAWYKTGGNLPSDWWDYDVDPNIGTPTPTLVGRGYVYNNKYGLPATEPDIMEVNYWYNVNGPQQWTLAPVATPIGPDSAVVLWWTNGPSPASPGFTLNPGQSLTFRTYYGINQEKLLTTPTTTPSSTQSPTVTDTFTMTVTPTISNTYTFTYTPTVTNTHTVTPTWTITKTLTSSPTYTVTRTITPTWTSSETFTITPTYSITPTVTETSTITETWTITRTWTVTETWTETQTPTFTPTATMTWSLTPTITLTPTPIPLVLDLKGNFPNPFSDSTHIVYWLSVDAGVTVKVFTVSGEVVRRKENISGHAGYNDFFWDGANNSSAPVASGIFIYRVYAARGDEHAESKFMKAACVK